MGPVSRRHVPSWGEISSLRISVPMGEPGACASLFEDCADFNKECFLAALDELSGERQADEPDGVAFFRYYHDMEICSGALAAARGGFGCDPRDPFVMREVAPLRANRIWSLCEGVTICIGRYAGLTTLHIAGDRQPVVDFVNDLLRRSYAKTGGEEPCAFVRDLNTCAKFWKGNVG